MPDNLYQGLYEGVSRMNPEQQEVLIMRLRKENEALKEELRRLREDQSEWFRFEKAAREERESRNALRESRLLRIAVFISVAVTSQFILDKAEYSYWGYAWREFVLILLTFPVCYLFTHGVKDFFYYHNEVPTLGGSILICLVFTAIATLTPDLLPFV